MAIVDWDNNWFGRLWNNVKTGYNEYRQASSEMIPGLVWDLFYADKLSEDTQRAIYGESDRSGISRAFSRFANTAQRETALVTRPLSSLQEVPILKDILHWYERGITYGVRRPIATAMLAGDAADATDQSFFSGETWRNAWNESERVTPGQAVAFNAAQLFGFVDADERDKFDPRTEAGRKHYYDDPLFQYASGSFDLGLMFVDPYMAALKLGKLGLGRAAASDTPVLAPFKEPARKILEVAGATPTQRMRDAGALEKEAFGSKAEFGSTFPEVGESLSPSYQRLFDAARGQNLSTFQRRYFNDAAFGGVIATTVWTMARSGDKGLFADSLLAARGSREAYGRLPTDAKAYLDRNRHALGIASAVDQYATQPAAKATVDGVVAQQYDAFIESFGKDIGDLIDRPLENTESFWFGYMGSVQNRGKIRENILSKFRLGLHYYGIGQPVSFFPGGMTAGRFSRNVVRFMNPSARYDSLIDVNSVASYRNFRYNMDRSILEPEVRDTVVSDYMRAATAEERSAIIAKSDEMALNALLKRFDMTKAELLTLRRELGKHRAAALDMLKTSPRHIPNDLMIAANKARNAGRLADAERLRLYAEEYQRLVDAGERPPTMHALPAGDRAYLAMAENPGKGFTQTRPFARSTTANLMPMMDYRALEVELRRNLAPYRRTQRRIEGEANAGDTHLKDLMGGTWYRNAGMVEGALKSIQMVWAVAALLRPAQVVRSAADDGMRAMVWHGMTPYMLQGMRGAARLGYRVTKQGIPMAQLWAKRAVTRLAGKKFDFDLPEIDLSAVKFDDLPGLKREGEGFYQLTPRTAGGARVHTNAEGRHAAADFDTMEDGIVRGVIPARAYLAYVEVAVREGRAPWPLVQFAEQLETGLITREMFDRRVYEYAMDQTGMSAYTNPVWQRDFFDGVKLGPRMGIITDPLRGTRSPWGEGTGQAEYGFQGADVKVAKNIYETHDTGPTMLVKVDSMDGSYRFDDLYDFLSAHAEDIVEKQYLVHGIRTSTGDIEVSLVRPRDTPRTPVDHMTQKQRLDIQNKLKFIGQEDLRMNLGGTDLRVRGAFAGMEGDWLRTTSSIGHDVTSAYASILALKETSRMKIIGEENKTIKPAMKTYPTAWEYTANRIVANDAVMRKSLAGESYGDILKWTSTTEGQKWVKARQQPGASVQEHVQAAIMMAERIVPDFGDLRKKVLIHDGRFKYLEEAIPDVKNRPDVLGTEDLVTAGKYVLMDKLKRGVDKWFKYMSDLPIDRLIRHPFAHNEYWNVLNPMLDNYKAYLQRTGKHGTQGEIERMESIARQQALDLTQRTLYDSFARTDAAAAFQLFMPFANAIVDSYTKWLRLSIKRPLQMTRMWHRYWMAPDRSGLVYDQDGYYLESTSEDGQRKERWISPLTGEEAPKVDEHGKPREHEKYVLFRMPQMGGKQIIGKEAKFFPAFNKDSMNPILSLPTAGPIVALPANMFLIDAPEVADKWYMQTFVLPFGVTDDSLLQQVSPGFFRTFVRWRTENQDMANSTAMQIYQMQLVDYASGIRAAPPSIDEAKMQASAELGLRFRNSFFSPVSLQYYDAYKPFSDYYRMLLEKHKGNENEAMIEFRQNAGDEFMYMTAHMSKANVSMPATKGSYKGFVEHEELIRKHPELSGMILGAEGAGSFNKAVYEWQKTIRINGEPLREIMSIKDSQEEVELRIKWAEYSALMDEIDAKLEQRGLTSLRSRGALDLAAAKQAWVEANRLNTDGSDISAWYKDYQSTDGSLIEGRLTAMRDVVSNTRLVESRMDLQGLQQYIYERDRMKLLMSNYGFKTLSARQAHWLSDQWDATVARMKSNLAFSDLYNRWLSRDDLSDPGGVPTGTLVDLSALEVFPDASY